MPIPSLKLSLVPPPTLWRQYHETIGWAALGVGLLVFAGASGITWRIYAQARRAGLEAVKASTKARQLARDQEIILRDLQSVDVAKDLPRWRLAERYYSERTLRWSRLMAEVERSLTRDVRLKSIHKVRATDQQVQLKLKGESRTREAEAAFVESLYQNLSFFPQILLERESERQGGGIDFDLTLSVNPLPGPYEKLPVPPTQYRDQKGVALSADDPLVKEWLAKGGNRAALPALPLPPPVPSKSAPKPLPPSPKAAPSGTKAAPSAPPAPNPPASGQPIQAQPRPAAPDRIPPTRETEGQSSPLERREPRLRRIPQASPEALERLGRKPQPAPSIGDANAPRKAVNR